MRKITTFDAKKNHSVNAGEYDESNNTYYREFKNSNIMRVAGNSVGMQDAVFHELKQLGCLTIVLTNINDGKIYESSIEDWESLTPADYGHGKQRFLSLRHMALMNGEES